MAKRDFPNRYASNWNEIRKLTLNLTKNRCCLCAGKAKAVHHVRYGIWDGKRFQPIAGKERPLIDVFPLCKECHLLAHKPWNWVWYQKDPEFGNHNTQEFVQKLQSSVKRAESQSPSVFQPREEKDWGAVVGMFFKLILS